MYSQGFISGWCCSKGQNQPEDVLRNVLSTLKLVLNFSVWEEMVLLPSPTDLLLWTGNLLWEEQGDNITEGIFRLEGSSPAAGLPA